MSLNHWLRRWKNGAQGPHATKRNRNRRRSRQPRRPPGQVSLAVEPLEERTLLAIDVLGALPTWMPVGPTLTTGGQVEGIPMFETRQRNDDLGPADPLDPGDFDFSDENPVIGAVNVVAAHPTNREILFAGAVNGGIWKTVNATDFHPTWESLTDEFPSLSIGSLEFDPTDQTGNTLLAGIGRASSFDPATFGPAIAGPFAGGPLSGLMRTTDGQNWSQIGDAGFDGIDNDLDGLVDAADTDEIGLPALSGLNIWAAIPRGNTILVGANSYGGGSNPGLYRTVDGGNTWTLLSGIDLGTDGVVDVVSGPVIDLEGDLNIPNRLYTAVLPQGASPGGLFRSTDFGATWTSMPAFPGGVINATTNNIELAVHSNSLAGTNRVYAAVMNNGILGGLFWAAVSSTGNFGVWRPMDVPQTNEGGGTFGIQPRPKAGAQGAIHFSMAADPISANIVYVGGDRQPGNVGAPPNDIFTGLNSVGASDYTGRLFRGDTSMPQGTGLLPSPQWTPLTHAFADGSAPHADSRDMAFDTAGDLIEVDDGGIYRRTNPQSDNRGAPFSSVTANEISKSPSGPIVVTAFAGVPHGLETGDRIRLWFQGIISGRLEVETILDGFFRVTRIDDFNFSVDGTNDILLPDVLTPIRWLHGRWFSLIGNLQVTEFHDIAWDSVSNEIIGGAQDTGTHQRSTIEGFFGNQYFWNEVTTADGGDVAVDPFSLAAIDRTIRYSSTQNFLGSFAREVYDESGVRVGNRVSVIPAAGLPNFTAPFVTPFAVNAIPPTPAQLSAGQSTRIVIGGGTNPLIAPGIPGPRPTVYESNNAGRAASAAAVNWTAVPTAPGFSGVNLTNTRNALNNAMVYGGMRAGQPNRDVLFVGSGNQVYVRTGAGGTLNPIPFFDLFGNPLAAPNELVTDVVVDPNNWWTAVAVTVNPGNPGRVYLTTNAGAANPFWTDITGNLPAINLRTVEFVAGLTDDAILVGTESGVWRMLRSNGGVWTEFGIGLPNAPVWDLDYNATDNILLAGTLGRGAWTLPLVRATVFSPPTLQINGSPGTDLIVLRALENNPLLFSVRIIGAGFNGANFPWSVFQGITINGLGGSDAIGVVFGDGAVPFTGSIDVVGGGGDADLLSLTAGTAADNVTVNADTVNLNGFSLTYRDFDNLNVVTGAGTDTIDVKSVPFGTTVSVFGGADVDTITVGGGEFFDKIMGPVFVNGSADDSLTIDDTLSNSIFFPGESYKLDVELLDGIEYGTFIKGRVFPSFPPLPEVELLSHRLSFRGVSTVTLDGGLAPTSFEVSRTQANVELTLNSNADGDTFNIGDGNYLENILSPITMNGQSSSLTINDQDDVVGDTVTELLGIPVTLFSVSDEYQLTSSSFRKSKNIWRPFPLPGVPNPEPVTGPRLTFNNFADVTLLGSGTTGDESPNGNSQFNIVGVRSGTVLTVNGNEGDDEFVVAGGNIPDLGGIYDLFIRGPVTINGGTGNNQLLIDDRRDLGDDQHYVLDGNTFTKTNTPVSNVPTLTFNSIATLTLEGSNANSTFDLEGSRSDVTVTLDGNGGDDTFNVGHRDFDSQIAGTVIVRGGSQTDTLNIDDTEGSTSDDYTITNNIFAKSSTNARVEYSSIANFNLDTNDQKNTIVVHGTAAALHINTHDEDDMVVLSPVAMNLDSISGGVSVNGGDGMDTVILNDRNFLMDGQLGTLPYFFDPGFVQKVLLPDIIPYGRFRGVAYDEIEDLTLHAANGDNALFVRGTSPGTNLQLFGNGGLDLFAVTAPPSSLITIDGGPPTVGPGDRLILEGTGTEIDGEYVNDPQNPTGGVISIGGQEVIQFSNLEPVTVSNFAKFTFVSGGSRDDIVVDSPEVERSRVGGTSDGLGFENLTFFDVREVVLDLARNDGADPDDHVLIQPGGLAARGLEKLAILTGSGEQDISILDAPVPVTVISDEGITHSLIVTNTSDSGLGSLRAAIEAANALAPDGPATIAFAIPATDPGFVDVDEFLGDDDADADPDVFVISPLSALPALTRGNIVINGQSQHSKTGDTNPFGPEIVLSGDQLLANDVVDGLVSRYRFEGLVEDIIGDNEPSATSGISFVDGQVGQGVTFEPGGYIDILHSDELAQQIFTLSAWVRPEGPGPNDDEFGNVIIQKGIANLNTSVGLWWSAQSQRFALGSGNVFIEQNRTFSADTFAPGQFYHVAATFDGSLFSLYVDGVLQGQHVRSIPIEYEPTIPWTIGSTAEIFRDRPGQPNFPRTWNGVIDEVSIYDRALSSTEIQSLAAPVGTSENGLHLASSDNLVHGLNIQRFSGDGVLITADGNELTGNYIGTDATGMSASGNEGTGVLIEEASGVLIGGMEVGARNLIAFNSQQGVSVTGGDSTGNAIRGNAIYSNGGLGIDLAGEGVTPNDDQDADSGPNLLQNHPELSSVKSGVDTKIVGKLKSSPNAAFTIDLYASSAADPSGFGEGSRWLGSTQVVTNEEGTASFNVTLTAAIVAGEVVTATATDAEGNTSEFSAIAEPNIKKAKKKQQVAAAGIAFGGSQFSQNTASQNEHFADDSLSLGDPHLTYDAALLALNSTKYNALDAAGLMDAEWMSDSGINGDPQEDDYDPEALFADLDLLEKALSRSL